MLYCITFTASGKETAPGKEPLLDFSSHQLKQLTLEISFIKY